MSDSISRSELLNAMNTWDKFGCDCHSGLVRIDNTNNEEYVPFVHYEDMVNCVKNMPTAYSVDKVVEELEKESKRWEDSGKEYEDKCEIAVGTGLRYAIEIVKQGGVSDVCEWECKYINDEYVYSTSCDNIFIYETNSVYCPYCGKKIKVVE